MDDQENVRHEPLTARELEILQLITEGLTNQQIADQLFLTLDTVKWYNRQTYQKLGVNSRTQAIIRARDLSLLCEPSAVVKHNLPGQSTGFIGREQELAEIRRLLLDEPDCRLLNLCGPGGIGKTRLALAAASQTLDAFPEGVYFVSLAPVSEIQYVIPAIAEALRFTFYDQTDPKDQLLGYLSQKQLLVVADSFEHLLNGADLLSDIVRQAPTVTLLVTSRERLNLREEWSYNVQGLAFPTAQDEASTALAEYSAVALFTQRARQTTADFAPSAAELTDIGRICQLMEGMPLGLELAAPWIRTLSCQDIAVEIEGSLDFLTTPLQNVPERHRSLRVVFEQTWSRLSVAEQAVLAKLSVFQDGFSRVAAVEVAGATLPLLSALVDKSLVTRSTMGQYKLHELLRQFAQEKLSTFPDDQERTWHQYCCFYATLLHGYALENQSNPGSTNDNLLNTLSDWPNVQAAWHHALTYSLIAHIGQFTYFMGLFYEFRGLIQEGERTFGLALARLRTQAEPGSPIVLMRVLTHYGWFCLSLSKVEQARQNLEEALALSSTLEDEADASDVGLMLHFLAWVACLQGQVAKAKELLQKSMEICQSAEYQMGIWMCTALWGEIEYEAGNYDRARRHYEQALSLCEDVQFDLGIVSALILLGNTYAALADYSRAADYLRRGLILNQGLLLIAPLFWALLGLAALSRRQGQHAAALELLVIILSHPQCSVVAQHKAIGMFREIQPHLTEDEMQTVVDKVKRGQVSNRSICPNFTVDAGFVERLLAVLDQAV